MPGFSEFARLWEITKRYIQTKMKSESEERLHGSRERWLLGERDLENDKWESDCLETNAASLCCARIPRPGVHVWVKRTTVASIIGLSEGGETKVMGTIKYAH